LSLGKRKTSVLPTGLFRHIIKEQMYIRAGCDNKMSEHLDKLKTLTGQLPVLADFIKARPKSNITVFGLPTGSIEQVGFYKTNDVAISKSFAWSGIEFPVHTHHEKEWLGVISGKIIVTLYPDTEREEKIYVNKHEVYYIPAHTPHSIHYIEDTELWAITMPANDAYPEGE